MDFSMPPETLRAGLKFMVERKVQVLYPADSG
jgi:hypothetical protein